MNGLPIQAIIALLGIGAVAALWLALRFGRAIALAVLALGILAVAVMGAGALLTQGAANYQTAKAATEAASAAKAASVGQSVTTVIVALVAGLAIGAAGLTTVAALGAAGYFGLRYKLAERGQLLAGQRRRPLPGAAQPGQVIYVTDEPDGVDLAGVDLKEWGW